MLTLREVVVEGCPARIWSGGEGTPLVLLHGAWGGAWTHWSPVWDRLAERFRVVAPELPGIAEGTQRGPRSLGDFARWVEHLLDALAIDAAWLVGNSFGGAVAWHVASRAPARCLGLVLVNSGLPPPIPDAARRLLAVTPLKHLLTMGLRRFAYSREALGHGFADVRRIPPELLRAVEAPSPPGLEVVREALLAGQSYAPPPQGKPTLLLFGAADQLKGTMESDARDLNRRLVGSRLALIPGAGHLPQIECPGEFVEKLIGFAAR